jgi:hypothetical protein
VKDHLAVSGNKAFKHRLDVLYLIGARTATDYYLFLTVIAYLGTYLQVNASLLCRLQDYFSIFD